MDQTETRVSSGGIDSERVAELAAERLDWRFKAVPASAWGTTVAGFVAGGPSLEDFGTPLLTLDESALAHNLRTMAGWCAAVGVDLAPHGKTTMAPALWERQLAAGARAITLANLPQVRVARAFGVRRVHLANTVLDPAGLRWIAAELDRDPDFSLTCWVDSVRAVELIEEALGGGPGLPGARPIDVCVELGRVGGRTGARTLDEALTVADAVVSAGRLRLVGVSGYEGALAHDAAPESVAAVEAYLRDLLALHDRIRDRGLLDAADETGDAVITAGGSAYFDAVARVLAPASDAGTRVVVRSGAYLIHDDGFYRGISPFARDGAAVPLRSAMHGWARVVSRPEPALALLDGGKRDFPYDEGLPEPQLVRCRGPLPGGAHVSAMNDQHAFLRDAGVSVGDVVRLGLSHPCTAFDKWALIPVVDDAEADRPVVVDLVRTFF
ncbi:alanine racemase [Actinoallomurus purpureus]|uniref:alanine racemase n=1 Tax=Actinoallomurus purpureus TaxID=478114 RepID=UPI002092920F|nr:alanine racemase [Actinoallomurus purpureus]MCO6009844.1 alanine racemase [Actinoallomurus purpureus]